MLKKYGWKYCLAAIGVFFLGILWPFGFFFCYMFKDEKDEDKRSLINKLNIISIVWFSMQIVAIVGKYISVFLETV